MMITGEIKQVTTEGRPFWYVTVRPIGVIGSGASRKAACADVAAALEELVTDSPLSVGDSGPFDVQVIDGGEETVLVAASDTGRLIGLLLREERVRRNLSLAEVAKEAGASSRNGYAQYERGKITPSVTKLQAMLDIVAPELVVAIIPRTARVISREKQLPPEFLRLLDDDSPETLAAWVTANRIEQVADRKAHENRRAARQMAKKATRKNDSAVRRAAKKKGASKAHRGARSSKRARARTDPNRRASAARRIGV